MELREAIKIVGDATKEAAAFGDGRWSTFDLCPDEQPSSVDYAIVEILNSVTNGTLIPTDACFNVDDGVLYQAMNDGYGRYDEFKRDVLMALEIRSADDVRREGYAEGYKDGFKKSGWEEMQRQTALIPAEQCFSVKEGYSASAFKNVDLEEGVGYSEDIPLSEALTIRSADDVRREAWLEVRDCVCKMNWPVDDADEILDAIKSALIDTPQPKGGDDE